MDPTASKNELDPFRVIIGVVAALRDSDLLIELSSAAGLKFDTSLSEPASYSHKTRVRELVPRVVSAYERLSESAALGAANALLAALAGQNAVLEQVTDALQRVGWDVRDTQLVVASPELREMFFPRDSQWDAYVVLRGLFAEATTRLVIVDPYCDETVFPLLAARSGEPLEVQILCRKSAASVAEEARAFVSQFAGWGIEVRRASDFHDRFVVIDSSSCVHIGASINGAGKAAFMISRIEDQANRRALMAQLEQSWSAATPI